MEIPMRIDEDIREGILMKLVIYKDLSGYCVTTDYNYTAAVQNARAITKCYDFENADEIIDYYIKYFGESRDNFIVIDK